VRESKGVKSTIKAKVYDPNKQRKKELDRDGSPNPIREEGLVAAVPSYRLVG